EALALGAGEPAAADRGVLALGVLAHDEEVDVARLAAGERTGHPRHQPHRPQVAVLVDLAPELDQRAPQRDVVGDLLRPSDRAEEDRIVLADLLLPVLRHHALMLGVVVPAREIEPVLPQLEAIALGSGFQRAHALGHHFLADAVTRDDGDAIDPVRAHAFSLKLRPTPRLRRTAALSDRAFGR